MRQYKHPRPGRIGFTLKFLLLSACFWSMTAFAQLTIEVEGKGVLAAVSTDGAVKQLLSVAIADAREPAWGPFNP